MKSMHVYKSISFVCFFLFSSCEKEQIKKNENIQPFEKFTKDRFDETPFKWDYLFSTVSKDNIFIGDKCLSVDNKFITTPVSLYLGAAFDQKDFMESFKPEITAPKNPLDIIFDFTKPFIGTINKESGSIGYKKLLSSALESKEYKEYIKNRLSPFGIKMTEIHTFNDIEKAFSINNREFGKLLAIEAKKKKKTANAKSRLLGVLTNRSFRTYMDIPITGLFKDKQMNISPQNPVYIYSITYGKTAFFVIESPYLYKDVEKALLSKISLNDRVDKGVEVLKKSAITLFIVSDSQQTAKVYSDYKDLDNFIKKTFNEESYGYPIYCQAAYTKDNISFSLK